MKFKYIFVALFMMLGIQQAVAQDMPTKKPTTCTFGLGKPLPEMYSKYFIGQAYLNRLATNPDLNCPIANVTFEPGCRNNWHSHTGGQILVAVDGIGYYQERGKTARLFLPGDVVEIAPNVEHWHGAAPNSWFSHLAIECNPKTNKNTWLEPVNDKEYLKAVSECPSTPKSSHTATSNNQKWFKNTSNLEATDPDLKAIIDNFAMDEVLNHGTLDTKTRIMVTLASCIAQHSIEEYKIMMAAALKNDVSPVELKEILYQSVAYVGLARVMDYIEITNNYLLKTGVTLPLPSQSTTSPKTRYEKGLALQKECFGDVIDKMREAAPENQKHIQRYLSANCFGDYQTRTGLSTQMRELLTYSMLISLGGCEPQVKGHILGNVAVGNHKEKLLEVTTQLLPYIGYPRTLNAIKCLNEMIPEKTATK